MRSQVAPTQQARIILPINVWDVNTAIDEVADGYPDFVVNGSFSTVFVFRHGCAVNSDGDELERLCEAIVRRVFEEGAEGRCHVVYGDITVTSWKAGE